MTNEEIAYKLHPYLPSNNGFTSEPSDLNNQVRTGFIEGAGWKDQQFKEYLEKKKAEIDRIDDYGIYTTEISLTAQSNLLDEIINELFKEEEK